MGKNSKNKRKMANNNITNRVTRSTTRGSMTLQTSSGAGSSCFESDIPGYYYDEEKKTYFKILPNTMSSVSSFVTNETIKQKAEENRRLSSLKGQEDKGKDSSSSIVIHNSSSRGLKADNMLSALNVLQCGQPTCLSLERYFMRQMCENLRPRRGGEAGVRTSHLSPDIIEVEGVKRFELNENCDKAVMVWAIEGSVLQYANLVSFDANTKECSSDGKKRLNIQLTSSYAGKITHRMTGLCWSPFPENPAKPRVLFSTMCPILSEASQVTIMDLEAATMEKAQLFSFDVGNYPIWSCAWNGHRARFSVGTERKSHVIDVHSRCKWTYSTLNSDALAQQFSPSNPHLLYTGTRNGKVLMLDLRAPDQNIPMKLNQKNPVVCLKFFSDENFLVASDFSGLITKWDVRFIKPVRSYIGLANSHYQIPFYIDKTEKFIYATGADGFCKIWDVADGSLLKSIAPPLPFGPVDVPPVSHLSDRWGGYHGNFGLLTAMSNRLFEYL